MYDYSNYIGIPFMEKGRSKAGLDCFGLIFLIYREQFGIDVPSYTEDYTTTKEGDEIAALIGRESLGWPEVSLADAQPGDVLILRVKGRPWHCGLVVDPPYFVHAQRVAGTIKERWDSLLWARRIVAVHRHPEMMQTLVGSSAQ